jgi:phosphatidylserine/phosphatidylglycerophosphate/cardiolipin synthase-like enzyme
MNNIMQTNTDVGARHPRPGVASGRGWGKILSRRLLLVLPVLATFAGWHVYKPLPAGLDVAGPFRPARDLRFLRDITHTAADGSRRFDQQIFDEVLAMIAGADSLLVIDMFLFNDFTGREDRIHRALSRELADAIIARRQARPALRCWLITDPINTWYGGLGAAHLDRLRAHGVTVVTTRLSALRDSNPAHSVWWRLLLRFWPHRFGPMLPNPVTGGRVPLRSYFDLFNFKANHRKTVIADRQGVPTALVTSANPHDASSAHHNVAVVFSGPAVADLLATEAAVCAMSGAPVPEAAPEPVAAEPDAPTPLRIRVLTERAVERAVLELLGRARAGDTVTLAMFYLASRPVVRALEQAHRRGAGVSVLLDPNKDAFGREKNGIPNRPVAAELMAAGIPVRWVQTCGEQFHTKLLVLETAGGELATILGSSNYTRRNLHNLNLETSVEIRGPRDAAFSASVRDYLALAWRTQPLPVISGDYGTYADPSRWRRMLYRLQEATGLSTF